MVIMNFNVTLYAALASSFEEVMGLIIPLI